MPEKIKGNGLGKMSEKGKEVSRSKLAAKNLKQPPCYVDVVKSKVNKKPDISRQKLKKNKKKNAKVNNNKKKKKKTTRAKSSGEAQKQNKNKGVDICET